MEPLEPTPTPTADAASTAPASTAPASTAPASTAPASTAPASTAPASTAPASTAIQAGRGTPAPGVPLNVPPTLASSFRLPPAATPTGTPANDAVGMPSRSYVRGDGSDAAEAFEAVLGQLEGGMAVSFASGMAAIAAALDAVPVHGVLAVPTGCYQGTAALAEHLATTRAVTLRRIEQDNTNGWLAALHDSDVVLLESPSNPMLRVADLTTICAVTPRRARVVVDSTLATPLNQQPLALGADVVLHSATKAIGGHADLLLGVAVTQDAEVAASLHRHRTLYGAVPGAMELFLATRGVRTLTLRQRQAEANAAVLAARLVEHPAVHVVHFPGLSDHPDHALAAATLAGFGSLVSFELHGDAATADRLCAALRGIVHATSLGGVETTIERRAAVHGQEHLPPTLLRMSVGCEDVEDLWSDLAAALAIAAPTGSPTTVSAREP